MKLAFNSSSIVNTPVNM